MRADEGFDGRLGSTPFIAMPTVHGLKRRTA